MLPLDFTRFIRYHPGNKLSKQTISTLQGA